MTVTITEIKKLLTDTPDITDAELMERYGVEPMLAISVWALILAEREQISKEELERVFPEFKKVEYRWNFKNWIVNALRSVWRLDRRSK